MSELPPAIRLRTSLTRVVDPSVPSNRFALFIAALGFAVRLLAGVLTEADGGVGAAVGAGVGAFLAWALARELDPDHTATARYAGFGAVALLGLGQPDLGALLAVLLAVRVITRSTGLPPTLWDAAGMVAVAWLAAGDPTGVVAAFATAGALVWDTRLPVRAARSSGVAGAVALTAAVVSAILGGALFAGWEAPTWLEAAVFLLAIGAGSRIGVTHVTSRADATDEPLHAERVHRARIATGVVLAGTLVWVGGPSIGALGGAWAAFIAVGATHWRPARRTAAAGVAAALLLVGCSAERAPEGACPSWPRCDDEAATPSPTASTQAAPAPAPSPSPSPSPAPPPPVVRTHADAADLAADLVAAERSIRDEAHPADHVAAWARIQQAGYRELAEHPDWLPEVRGAVPQDIATAFERNAEAQRELHALTKPRDQLPNWTIVAPPPAAELRAAYDAAAAEFGVDWSYLAAIHLVETRMGRIQGDSSAGARGPMQFMPATWDAYGEGDIEDPTDAIRAAARYLVAHGAPARMGDALYAYNHSQRYVTAVANYAQVMQDDPGTYEAYHAWQVYYRLTTGSVVLEEGWSAADR